MNSFLDHFLVGAVLAAGFGYAIYSLGPRALRTRLLLGIGRSLDALPRFAGLQGVAQRLTARAAQKAAGACGGCDNCGTEGQKAASSPEIRVPLSNIGKRH